MENVYKNKDNGKYRICFRDQKKWPSEAGNHTDNSFHSLSKENITGNDSKRSSKKKKRQNKPESERELTKKRQIQ